jgi:CDP-diacylglycerol pyrophosphatase
MDNKLWLRAGLAGTALCVIAFVAVLKPAFADRMTLWNIVHGACAPHEEAGQGPAPCVDVDIKAGEDKGVALLKDLHGVAQELAIPTGRVIGIEDPQLLSPGAPDYFAYAWKERAALETILKRPLPREAVGVAVNSMYARSQDQLHLHIDCMDKGVVAALGGYQDALDATFRPMTIALNGRTYWARAVTSADLAQATPFTLLADGIAGARAQMGAWSILLVGATIKGEPGFVLLADHAEMLGGGHAEALQDHECAIAGGA